MNGRPWFGRLSQDVNGLNDCTVVMCQECYTHVIKDTCLEKWLGNDLTAAVYHGDTDGSREVFCEPWSKISKAVLKLAAETDDFKPFVRHWNHRT